MDLSAYFISTYLFHSYPHTYPQSNYVISRCHYSFGISQGYLASLYSLIPRKARARHLFWLIVTAESSKTELFIVSVIPAK